MSTKCPSASGGNHYNHKDSSQRQDILNRCFRHTTADGFRKSGIIGASAANRDSPFRVFEIGCGSCATTMDIATVLPFADITAIDADPDLIASAKKARKVWFRFVLIRVPDPVKLLRSAMGSLQPGGTMFVEDCDSRGQINDPPFLANEWLHRKHEEASFKLGADVRRGSRIGRYLSSFGNDVSNIHCETFAPLFGKGEKVKSWCNANITALGQCPSQEEHYALGMELLKGSVESVSSKFLELDVCTQRDIDLASKSIEQVEDDSVTSYQIFSIPGGTIFQWWATKSIS